MNLIDEENRAPAILRGALGVGHHSLDFFDSAGHRTERDEITASTFGDDLGKSRLARSRRSPQDQRRNFVAFDLPAQRFTRREDLFLSGEFLQRPRTHAIGQWTRRGSLAWFRFNRLE